MNNLVKAVYVIVEDDKLEKPIWRRIGSCYVNRDDSLNVFLDAMPTNGKLHIRDVESRDLKVKEAA